MAGLENCEGLLTDDILFDCENTMVGGLEANIVLIPRVNLNYAEVEHDPANKMLVTNLICLPGKKGYRIQHVKQVHNASSEFVPKQTGPDKHKHLFKGVVLNFNVDNKLQAQQMSEGGKYVAVIELLWKGEDAADAFQILGLKCGLGLSLMTWNANENDATIQFELSSAENLEEPTLPLTLLITDYATTKTAFGNCFVGPAVGLP